MMKQLLIVNDELMYSCEITDQCSGGLTMVLHRHNDEDNPEDTEPCFELYFRYDASTHVTVSNSPPAFWGGDDFQIGLLALEAAYKVARDIFIKTYKQEDEEDGWSPWTLRDRAEIVMPVVD